MRMDELERLTRLWKEGALTDQEFAAEKVRLLAGGEDAAAERGAMLSPRAWKIVLAVAGICLLAVAIGIAAGHMTYAPPPVDGNALSDAAGAPGNDTLPADDGQAAGPGLPADDAEAARLCMAGAARGMRSTGGKPAIEDMAPALYYGYRAIGDPTRFFDQYLRAVNDPTLRQQSLAQAPDAALPAYMAQCEARFPGVKAAHLDLDSMGFKEQIITCMGEAAFVRGLKGDIADSPVRTDAATLYGRMSHSDLPNVASLLANTQNDEEARQEVRAALGQSYALARIDVAIESCLARFGSSPPPQDDDDDSDDSGNNAL